MELAGGSKGVVSHLRSVIDDHLRQFTELELVSLTLDNQRNLLISLSKVLKEIKNLTVEIEVDEQICGDSDESFNSQFSDLTSILSKLILCLNVKSKYVEHLVTSIFVAISEFLLSYGFLWNNFIQLLCGKLELALCDNDAHSIRPSFSEGVNSESSLFKLNPAKANLNNSPTWNILAGIMGILRGIMKHLKGEDKEFVRVLWNSLSTSLSKAPWDVLEGIHKNKNSEHGICHGEDTLAFVVASYMETKIMFLGNLVQLLCSLVGQAALPEASSGIDNDESAYVREICEFVPRLLNWCLGKQSQEFKHIFPYFQHKTLMLMTRLSYCMQFDRATLSLWLELLHKYYQDFLTRPISLLRDGEDEVLEGSPFVSSFYDQEGHPLSLWHLQRQAVFLFLRCIHLKGLSPYSPRASKSNSNSEVLAEKKELLDLFNWLRSYVPSIMLSTDELNLDRLIEFASSFIKLYIHEDDMLFEMLLLMFTIYSRAEEGYCEDSNSRKDLLFHISNCFNPLLLFHILLAELQYDHQLLLDYLISKDSGSKCAEYLLRCLGFVCDSWPLFVEFFDDEEDVCWENSVGEQLAIPPQPILVSSFEQNPAVLELKSKISEYGNMNFDNARACLLSLKSSLQRLHRRKLFPYNPEVLIRRLTMFGDLCNHDF